SDNMPVVGKIHVEINGHRIVMLPDGQLVTRTIVQAPVTDKPFQPIDKAKLEQRLLLEFPKFRTLKTTHYLFIYNTSDLFAAAASRIMDTMYPGIYGYAELQRFEVHKPEVPLVVLMFRTEREFQKYQRMPPGLVAYYNTLSNRVVMYEESKIAKIEPELAIQQSISTIAHEGVHQILHNIGVQQRLSVWPMWLSEGVAEYFAPTSLGKDLKWKGAGQVNDLRMFEIEHYLKSREPNNEGEMVQHTVLASRLSSTGYASAWSLTYYLAKHRRKEFNRYLRDVGTLGPLEGPSRVIAPGIVPSNLADFKEYFGSETDDLERRIVATLNALPYNAPFAEWPHFVAMASLPAGRAVQKDANVFHAYWAAQRWLEQRQAALGKEDRDRFQSQIQQFDNRAIAEQFARRWLDD
ncbi:MAG: hypothetical protein ACI9G1_006107, partial [Pirellulaceae bacterium]